MSAGVRRVVFQRDQCCQWVDPVLGRRCVSRHLLEVDHIVPKWAGGGNEIGNLELKCRAHNQMKYKKEARIRAVENGSPFKNGKRLFAGSSKFS